VVSKWVDELRAAFDSARAAASREDAAAGASPLPASGDALSAAKEIGKKVGDSVQVNTPGGGKSYEVVSVVFR
jgi:hypothetical protein